MTICTFCGLFLDLSMSAQPSRDYVPYEEFAQLRAAREILQRESEAIRLIAEQLDDRFCAAVDAILACTGRVIVTGIGKAGLIGQKIAATFASMATPSQFLHPAEAVHGDLGIIQSGDVVLALSNSGETEELCRMLPILARMHVPVIAITASGLSSLGRAATVVIPYGRHQEAGFHGLAPTTTTTIMLALGDALGIVTATRKGVSAEQFARYHPAGSLGKRLTPVQDVMRKGEALRVASEHETVREVFSLHHAPGRRTGAIVLVDAEGLLTGLFTDSDLARLLESHREHQLDRPILEVMTKHPTTINPEALLEDVVQIFTRRKFSELPVVDDAGHPIGMVDITDIIALLPTCEGT